MHQKTLRVRISPNRRRDGLLLYMKKSDVNSLRNSDDFIESSLKPQLNMDHLCRLMIKNSVCPSYLSSPIPPDDSINSATNAGHF